MTNKEKYKQAFSVLQPSGKIFLEEERMIIMKKKARIQTAIAAAVICLAFASGSSIAYAADLGGIQRKIQLWVHGDQTDADFIYNARGSYDLLYQNTDGVQVERHGGGIAIEEDGSERPLTEDEIMDQLNQPTVDYREDGTVWVYYYDQQMNITNQFKDGVCYVKVSNGENTLYMTILYQGGWCSSPHKYKSPDSFGTSPDE